MQDLKQLYHKFLSRQCTPDEVQALMDHFHLNGAETELREIISAQLKIEEYSKEDSLDVKNILSANREIIDRKIRESVRQRRPLWQTYLSAAAALILVSALSWYFFNLNAVLQSSDQLIKNTNDIGPGGSRAMLRLHNGKTVKLAERDYNLVVNKNGAFSADSTGKLIHNLQTADNTNDSEYYTISTPEGGIYHLTTPDGSKIWLNAASELQFPASFGSGKRIVKLKGEAYFEIAKDKKHPFVVRTEDQETEVLGTHFNINSYSDEEVTTTTLIEGAVRIHALKTSRQTLLLPGQQSVLKGEMLSVGNADALQTLDWMSGKVVFKDEDLKSIMRKISRWYGVEARLDKDVAHLKFWGAVSRKENLSVILNYLKETEDLDYKLTGKTVYIFKEKK